MRKREITDRRWHRVELPSLWRVLTRVHGEENAGRYEKKADKAIKKTGRYKEWLSVRLESPTIPPERCQITGYRRANPKEWFVVEPSDGGTRDIFGPFKTKKLALHMLRAKSATKIDTGVYAHGDIVLFTRDRADAVKLTQEDLL